MTTTINEYDVGDLIRCTGTFTDASDTETDPDTVTFKARGPSGNITTYVYGVDAEVVKSSTGVYYVNLTIDESGFWYYRFAGTASDDTAQGADENHFKIELSAF